MRILVYIDYDCILMKRVGRIIGSIMPHLKWLCIGEFEWFVLEDDGIALVVD